MGSIPGQHNAFKDPALLQLWWRPAAAAAARIQFLAWELPCAVGAAVIKKKKKKSTLGDCSTPRLLIRGVWIGTRESTFFSPEHYLLLIRCDDARVSLLEKFLVFYFYFIFLSFCHFRATPVEVPRLGVQLEL